jgi:signal transduction histidine kinase
VASRRNRKKKERPSPPKTQQIVRVKAPAPPKQPRRASPRQAFSILLPRTFQGRLTVAFVLVFALAVGMVSILTIWVLNADLRGQEETNLEARTNAVAVVVKVRAETAASQSANDYVVSASGVLNDSVSEAIGQSSTLSDYANNVAQADLQLRFGLGTYTSGRVEFIPAVPASTFGAQLTAQPGRGQARDEISYSERFAFADPAGVKPTWYLEVSLSHPYTTRNSTIATVVGFLLIVSLGALVGSIVMARVLATRFTMPLRRLTEAARALADGDLARRVPTDQARTGAAEITELSRQFNTMAEQVEETMEVIRRDRDVGREFLADVSHELRTPLAALRTFNELLQAKAGDDVAARTEFLEASAQQIERLDWLAQNLLELSKLDSGLIRLDLRPDDLRATILSAVEQAQVSATRRGIQLTAELPDEPLVTRHDPQRFGQVMVNLIGNALKFTPRGGSVRVALTPSGRGAAVSVVDTGVGIDPGELPHIFERFYRGSRANEARGSGSGLGLAIVRSVVDMHRGRIKVESRVGAGTTFTVVLPADPRTAPELDPGSSTTPGALGAAVANAAVAAAGGSATSGGNGSRAGSSGSEAKTATAKDGEQPAARKARPAQAATEAPDSGSGKEQGVSGRS